jgi:hypothetical protein
MEEAKGSSPLWSTNKQTPETIQVFVFVFRLIIRDLKAGSDAHLCAAEAGLARLVSVYASGVKRDLATGAKPLMVHR